MNFKKLASVLAIVAGAAVAPASQAAFIFGDMSLADGFDTTDPSHAAIVSTLTAIDVGDVSFLSGCVGDLLTASCNTANTVGTPFMNDFALGTLPVLIAQFDGFTFAVNEFTNIVRGPLASINPTQLKDTLDFVGSGVVTGNGFDPTAFSMAFSAQGTCNASDLNPTECLNGGTASWSASFSATGDAPRLPEPGSLALVGVALVGVVFSARRKPTQA